MLDTAVQRNSIKSDSIATDNRNPESSKKFQDGKFESMLAKAKTQESEAKEAKTESKDVQKDSKDKKIDRAQASKANAPFEFKDSVGGESKIGLQEKISKSTKENPKPQDNPLAQILSSSSLASAQNTAESKSAQGNEGNAKQVGKIESKNPRSSQAPMARSLPLPTQRELDSAQAQLDSQANPIKTLADVQDLAKQKNLNPGKIVLEDEVGAQAMQSRARSKVIPDSAKEQITYEYENNTDRIAVVQRGVKKPKNITSKISPEYPTKKTDEDVEVGRALPKERPQLV